MCKQGRRMWPRPFVYLASSGAEGQFSSTSQSMHRKRLTHHWPVSKVFGSFRHFEGTFRLLARASRQSAPWCARLRCKSQLLQEG